MIEFEEPITLVKESVGKAEIKLVRVNGADGRVSVHYQTKDIDAVAIRDYERECYSTGSPLDKFCGHFFSC